MNTCVMVHYTSTTILIPFDSNDCFEVGYFSRHLSLLMSPGNEPNL